MNRINYYANMYLQKIFTECTKLIEANFSHSARIELPFDFVHFIHKIFFSAILYEFLIFK